jgi:creatinine amidohydrolase
MLWLELTSPDLERETRNGAIAVMVVALVEVASEKEHAVVLPPLPFAYVPENRHFPGTMTMEPELLLKMLGAIADEVSRNGFKKLLLINGHGGNNAILDAFVMGRSSKRDPIVYAYLSPWDLPKDIEDKVTEGLETGHACVIETSRVLALFKDLVKMDHVRHPAKKGSAGSAAGVISSYWWQAKCPELYFGDPRMATEQKGKIVNDVMVENMVRAIRSVKEDDVTAKIADDFHRKAFKSAP